MEDGKLVPSVNSRFDYLQHVAGYNYSEENVMLIKLV